MSTHAEGRLVLAILAIESGQFQSIRRAAQVYDIKRSTLQNRLRGITARGDYIPNNRNLTKNEEAVIIKYILNLDSRGFSPWPRDI